MFRIIDCLDSTGSAKYLFFLNALKKNYWIFSQISFFIWKYNPACLCLFSKECGPIMPLTKIRTKQWLVLGASAFQCMRPGFLCLICDNFACLHTRPDQNEFHMIWYYIQSWFPRRTYQRFPSHICPCSNWNIPIV